MTHNKNKVLVTKWVVAWFPSTALSFHVFTFQNSLYSLKLHTIVLWIALVQNSLLVHTWPRNSKAKIIQLENSCRFLPCSSCLVREKWRLMQHMCDTMEFGQWSLAASWIINWANFDLRGLWNVCIFMKFQGKRILRQHNHQHGVTSQSKPNGITH